jgi:hypothetical protein
LWLKPLLIRRESKARARSAQRRAQSIAPVVTGVSKPELFEV